MAFGKARPDAPFELRRQVDFRHQHQHLPAGRQHRSISAQIDLGLAAAGDAMQQMGAESGLRIDGGQGRGCSAVSSGGLADCGGLTARAARRIGAVDPLQPGGKRLHDDFAERSLIVSTGKFAEPKAVGGQRRQVAQDVAGRFQLRRPASRCRPPPRQ